MSGGASLGADIMHLDMDCFFAAVEVREDPALRGLPVVVGGTGTRGVVASASYEARAYGVRSAMPTAVARRMCPQARFVSPRHGHYGTVSAALMEILREVTPLVEPVSLDEAFLDVSGAHRLLGSSEAIAHQLRARVRADLELDCSVGVGRTKLVAKLASRAAKPPIVPPGTPLVPGAGVVVIEHAAEREFLDGHVVRAVPGVGPRTAETLARIGVERVSDLASVPLERLERRFGKSRGRALFDLARGIDARGVEPDRATRSIGHEETFGVDVEDEAELRQVLRRQSESVARRCREAGLVGRTVSIKVRYGDFSTITRAHSEREPLGSATAIARIAEALYAALEVRIGVRLIGVSVSTLEPAGTRGHQLELFATDGEEGARRDDRHEEVELAADAVRRRFGDRAINRAIASLGIDGAPRPPR